MVFLLKPHGLSKNYTSNMLEKGPEDLFLRGFSLFSTNPCPLSSRVLIPRIRTRRSRTLVRINNLETANARPSRSARGDTSNLHS